MDTNLTWIQISHGYESHMDTNLTWIRISHGYESHMDTNLTWIRISHGHKPRMEKPPTCTIPNKNTTVCSELKTFISVGNPHFWMTYFISIRTVQLYHTQFYHDELK